MIQTAQPPINFINKTNFLKKRGKSKKKRTKKEITAIIIVCIIILTLLSSVIGFLVSAGYAANIKRFFSDLNPFKSAKDKNETSGEGGTITEPPANKTSGQAGGTAETPSSTPAATEEVEQPDGTGKLSIKNEISAPYDTQYYSFIHRSNADEGLNSKDVNYTALFNPLGIKSKIISRIPDYELEVDSRPLYSPSTLYPELSLHSQDGSDIVVNGVENELRLSFPKVEWEFGSQNIFIQQYNPNASSSYTLYNVRKINCYF